MDYDSDMMYDDIDEDLLQAYLNGEPLDPELEELLSSYQSDYEFGDDGGDISRVAISELLENCVLPVIGQAIQTLLPLCVVCIIFRAIQIAVRPLSDDETGIPSWFLHLTSALFGVLMLHLVFNENMVYILVCTAIVYVVMVTTATYCKAYCGVSVSCFIVLYIVLCELYLVQETAWHSIRGAQIILSMKVIGLSFDVSSGAVEMPSVQEYLGYVLCVGTVIFGPWVSYNNYKNIYSKESSVFNVEWLLKVVRGALLGLSSMMISTCVSSWLILDDNYKWVLAYRDAQSFRFSHYFVSYVSEVTSTLTGHSFMQTEEGDVRWLTDVTKPHFIEIPRSLVEVVTYWNLPMHYWLKTYVFRQTRLFGTFAAVLLTYAASSLLHGLNFQLAAVLFSLGFYSYVEFVFRDKLARIFNACVKAKKCQENCNHEYTSYNPFVMLVNLVFGALSVFHLAYLGLMFDSSSEQEKGYTMQHTLNKWSNLGFTSHWVILGTYIFHLLI